MVASIKGLGLGPSIPLLGHWPKWSSFGLRNHASPLLWLVFVVSPSSDMTPVCHSGFSRFGIQDSNLRKLNIILSQHSLSFSFLIFDFAH